MEAQLATTAADELALDVDGAVRAAPLRRNRTRSRDVGLAGLCRGTRRVATALAIYPEDQITVVLYTQEQFRDITRSPQWAAASYDGRIRIPVRGTAADSGELERVLVHEFTHALIQSVAPRRIPTWLHEGLAVAFEPDGEAWAAAQLTGVAERLPLARLAGSFAPLSASEARLAYARSAGLVRAMLDRDGATSIGALLQDVARGHPLQVAFERQYLMSFEAFLDRLAQ
jgi:hypothetical protein